MAEIQLSIFGEESRQEALVKASVICGRSKDKRIKFAYYFLGNGKTNASEAMRLAGYAEKTIKAKCSAIVADPQVQAILKQEEEALKKECRIDAAFLARETLEMIERNKAKMPQRFFVKTKHGGFVAEEKLNDDAAVARGIEILGKLTGSFSETRIVEADIFGKWKAEEEEKLLA